MDGTPVPVPQFGWSVDGTPVAGGDVVSGTVVGASVEVSGTNTTVIGAGSVSQVDISVLPGTIPALGVMVVIGGFLLIRWLVKSIPFM